MMGYLGWIKANYVELLLALSAVVGAAEAIVRMTPTKADDSAMERIGKIMRKVMDFFKVPNVKRK